MFKLPNLFTAANLLSGCVAIIFTFSGRLDLAPFAIFAGALFDFGDGFVARKMNIMGEIGKQLDSLADMVTFGVAPGMIMFIVLLQTSYGGEVVSHQQWLDDLISGENLNFYPLAALIIPFFSVFRLAKFNLDTRQTESFIGLPTPANTLFFMSYPLVMCYSMDDISSLSSAIYELVFHPIFICLVILGMSLMLISELPLFSLKFKTFGWKGNEIRYLFLLISLIFILLFSTWAFALIVFLYLILSLIENYVFKTQKE